MNSNAVYIIPPFPIFQKQFLPHIENFNDEDKISLYSNLFVNLVENLNKLNSQFSLFCFLDITDEKYIPEEFVSSEINLKFFNITEQKLFIEKLAEKYFLKFKNNIIIRSNLIGINATDLEKLFGLLHSSDETMIISKTNDNKISLFGFNKYTETILNNLVKSEFNYERFLYHLNPTSYFIHVINELLMVNDINGFKKLYLYLSQKKSIEYCSQEMHERFTNLFIEYKDLLK